MLWRFDLHITNGKINIWMLGICWQGTNPGHSASLFLVVNLFILFIYLFIICLLIDSLYTYMYMYMYYYTNQKLWFYRTWVQIYS